MGSSETGMIFVEEWGENLVLERKMGNMHNLSHQDLGAMCDRVGTEY